MNNSDLLWLVEKVRNSKKYRHVNQNLIERIAANELARHSSRRAADKATRGKLHQIAGAYAAQQNDYARWLRLIAIAVDPQARRQQCRQIMEAHASTRERLPLLDDFYRTVLADLPPIHSIVDLGCGLNPLTLPWILSTSAVPMNKAGRAGPSLAYYAYDIYDDLADFLNAFLPKVGVAGAAYSCDLTAEVPLLKADAAFIFKVLPVLEHLERGASERLLAAVDAPLLLVSYPTKSLGGRQKGMVEQYTAQFSASAARHSWAVQEYLFDSEIVFRVQR